MTVQKEVLVLGAGGEVPQYLEALELQVETNAVSSRVIGILDDNPQIRGTTVCGYEVLGPLSLAREMSECGLLWGLGNPTQPTIRLEVASRLHLPSERFMTLVHPGAFVSRRARLDPGVIVLGGSYITSGSHLAAHVSVGFSCVIEHETYIGPGSLVGAGVMIAGRVAVGAGTFLGQACSIKDHVQIGNAAIVGMGAAVLDDVEDGQTVAGVPARLLASRAVPGDFDLWVRNAERGSRH
jgi:sugar O-acyltransferase (sialic acid O-acetyltransferase NeuD family)